MRAQIGPLADRAVIDSFDGWMLTRVTRSTIPGRLRADQLSSKKLRPSHRVLPPTMSTASPSGQARAPPNGWRDRIKGVLMSRDTASRIRKRRKIAARAWQYVNVLRCVTH